MMKKLLVVSLLISLSALGWAGSNMSTDAKDDGNAAAAFNKLKTLVGQWEASSEKGKVTSSYELVSNGTALVEHITVPGEGTMLTVYNRDGNRLVLTHYCSEGNQPRMQAEAFDPASNQIRFDFLSAGNLGSAADGHMHSAKITLLGPDTFNAEWAFYRDGKAAFSVPIQFHRVR